MAKRAMLERTDFAQSQNRDLGERDLCQPLLWLLMAGVGEE